MDALGELHFSSGVLLRERRIGQHSVELHEHAVFDVRRLEQRVLVLDVGSTVAVENHVHLADSPRRSGQLLAEQFQCVAVTARLLNVAASLNQHAAGAACGVRNRHAFNRLQQLNQEAHNLCRGIKLTTLLACGVGEILDEEFVTSTEQVGELKVRRRQRQRVEVRN